MPFYLGVYMKRNNNNHWVLFITILSFIISIIFSYLSDIVLNNSHIVIGILVLLFVISTGIIFDMIGISVTTCPEYPFHAMASRKIKGSKTAIKLIKNKDRVSSFCNDVIGDICGVISGTASVMIATSISNILNINILICSLLLTSIISSLTIGGKALGKKLAVNNNEKIVKVVSKVLSIF